MNSIDPKSSLPEADQLFRLLRQLDLAPEASQRATAAALGVSLGGLNAQLRAAVEAGLIRIDDRKSDDRRQRFAYALTARGEELRGTLSHIGEVSQAWVAQGWSAKQGFPNQGTSQDISDP